MYVLNPWPTYGVFSHTGRIYASKSPGVENEIGSSCITPNNPVTEILFIIPTLGSVGLGGLSS